LNRTSAFQSSVPSAAQKSAMSSLVKRLGAKQVEVLALQRFAQNHRAQTLQALGVELTDMGRNPNSNLVIRR
jgi:hypothetical protein